MRRARVNVAALASGDKTKVWRTGPVYTAAVSGFDSNGMHFEIDRVGVEVEGPEPIEVSIALDDLDFGEDPVTELAARLSKLLGEAVHDEEGLYDFAVTREGELVAALVLACEEDEGTLELGGERVATVSDEDIAACVASALSGEDPS